MAHYEKRSRTLRQVHHEYAAARIIDRAAYAEYKDYTPDGLYE